MLRASRQPLDEFLSKGANVNSEPSPGAERGRRVDTYRGRLSRLTRVLSILVLLVAASAVPYSGIVDARTTGTSGLTSTTTGTEPLTQATSVRGEPHLEVLVPANVVVPGKTHELELVVANDGEISYGVLDDRNAVTKARNVRLAVESDDEGPVTVETGTQALGSITEDQPKTAAVQLTVADDAAPGEYDLDVELDYSYTDQISERSGVTSDESGTVTRTITVEVDDDARFAVLNSSTTSPVGDAGTLLLELENVGNQVAYDSRVTTRSGNGKISFQESRADEVYVGTWEPGDVKTVTHDVNVREGSSVRPYPLDLSVEFSDSDGIEGADGDIVASITPKKEQTFDTTLTGTDLRVGEDGEVVGEITNVGPHPVEDVILTFPDGRNIYPKEPEYSIASVGVGESAAFRFPIEVGTEAEPVRKQFDLRVRYRNHDGDVRRTDDPNVHAEILEGRDEFVVEPVDPVLYSGAGGPVDFQITNNLDQPVDDVHVKLFVDDPFSSADDEAFVPRLEPTESADITFDLGVDDDALQKTHSLTVDVKYDDATGETELSNAYDVPIEVQEPDDDQVGYVIPGVVAVVLAGVVGLWWRRRTN